MEGTIALFIPIVGMLCFFGFLVAVIVVPIWLRERTKQSAHKLVSDAIAKGQTLDPALIEKLTEAQHRPPPADRARKSLGSGVVMLALAIGFMVASYLDEGAWTGGGLSLPAAILGTLGIAFVVLAIIDYSTKKKTEA